MSRQDREIEVRAMCSEHGCSEKIRKIHFDQYVHRQWHPHPPAVFVDWWKSEPEYLHSIDAKRAYNCQVYRDRFLEAKQHGLGV